jgi:type IX secretion system PorP/SprF family membrane protein
MNRYIYLILFCCTAATVLKAQDPILSQYYAAPQYLNPAMTGVFKGSWRFNANYRQQWTNIFADVPIRTIHAGADMKFNLIADDYLAVGLNLMQDEMGGSARLQQTRGLVSVSYMKQLGGRKYGGSDQYLIAGGQFGAGQHSLSFRNLLFDRQYDSLLILLNGAFPSGEAEPKSNLFGDFNMGLMWYAVYADNRSFYIGGALNHLTKPNVSFLQNKDERLYRRWTVHGGGELPLNRELSLMPSLMFTKQGPSFTTQTNVHFRYTNHDWYEMAIRAGIGYRMSRGIGSGLTQDATLKPVATTASSILGDALILSMILEMERWNFGFSYDMHTSSLVRPTNYRGGYELSLIYTQPTYHRVRTTCPKF